MGGSPRERFVRDVLDGRLRSPAQVAEQGRVVGFELPQRCLIVVLLPRTARDAPKLRELAPRLATRFDGCAVGIRREPRAHAPLIARGLTRLDSGDTDKLALAVAAHFIAFVASTVVTDIAATYTVLLGELDLARASGQRVVQRCDLTTERVLREASLSTSFDFLRAVLGPVLANGNATVLLSSLEMALAWNGPLKKLPGIAYSTVRSHIDRVETLTGLRLTRPRDRVKLDTAMLLWRLNEEALPEPGKKWRDLAAG